MSDGSVTITMTPASRRQMAAVGGFMAADAAVIEAALSGAGRGALGGPWGFAAGFLTGVAIGLVIKRASEAQSTGWSNPCSINWPVSTSYPVVKETFYDQDGFYGCNTGSWVNRTYPCIPSVGQAQPNPNWNVISKWQAGWFNNNPANNYRAYHMERYLYIGPSRYPYPGQPLAIPIEVPTVFPDPWLEPDPNWRRRRKPDRAPVPAPFRPLPELPEPPDWIEIETVPAPRTKPQPAPKTKPEPKPVLDPSVRPGRTVSPDLAPRTPLPSPAPVRPGPVVPGPGESNTKPKPDVAPGPPSPSKPSPKPDVQVKYKPNVPNPSPPRSRTRERKFKGKWTAQLAVTLFKTLDRISEASEVVDCLYEQLTPATKKKWKRKGRGLIDNAGQYGIDGADWKLQAIWHNMDQIGPEQFEAFLKCVAKNELEDRIIGEYHRRREAFRPRNLAKTDWSEKRGRRRS